jgi:hypothetical protein
VGNKSPHGQSILSYEYIGTINGLDFDADWKNAPAGTASHSSAFVLIQDLMGRAMQAVGKRLHACITLLIQLRPCSAATAARRRAGVRRMVGANILIGACPSEASGGYLYWAMTSEKAKVKPPVNLRLSPPRILYTAAL